MIVHPMPTPHVHACPEHLLGSDAAGEGCYPADVSHTVSWHTASDPYVTTAKTQNVPVVIPPAVVATIVGPVITPTPAPTPTPVVV